MKKLFTVFLFLAACFLASNKAYPAVSIKFVKHDATGSGNGSSWANAYTSLQTALDNTPAGYSIWVAKGTYYPSSDYGLNIPAPNTARGYHFRMKKSVPIYGGFAGNESYSYNLDQRDFVANETILSGDIGVAGDAADNCYHVFYHPFGYNLENPLDMTILDGFTITGGNANGSGTHNQGGGIYNSGNNVYALGLNKPTIKNCRIIDNLAQFGAGICNVNLAQPRFTNCVIAGNTSSDGGAGIFNDYSYGYFYNCTITNNSAGNGGGVYCTTDFHVEMYNSIVWGNTASASGHQFFCDNGECWLNSSCYSNSANDVYETGGGSVAVLETITSDPQFVDADNLDFRILGTSPCADAGDNEQPDPEMSFAVNTDIRGAGFGRKLNKTDGTAGTVDMGAYEYKFNSDPAADGPANPTSFTAAPQSSAQINITWALNGNSDPVVLAFNTTSTFGTPAGTYNAGDPVSGGGTVLYTGSNLLYNHTGLSPNTRYYYKIWSKDGSSTYSNGAIDNDWTLANVPSAPTVDNPTLSTLDVTINVNGNPAATEFAIQDSANNLYVKADGTRQADAVWQTAASWGTTTVTGLTIGATYYFRVKARNGGNVETDFSLSSAGSPCANPTDGGTIGTTQTICSGSTPNALTNIAGASNYGGVLEYQWQQSTTGDNSGFTDIAGADTAGFVPGTLTVTTWFRRLAKVTCKPGWTGAVASNVVKITVDPVTVGGSITGDTDVCYGNHTSVLTLTGYTGAVQKWQYSEDGTAWNDIASSSNTTYTAENLTVDTWYRAVVQSGVCQEENSAHHKISVSSNSRISGYAKYENNPKTPLSGLKVLLKEGDDIIDSVLTTSAGYYEFDSVANGNFGLVVKSAHSSGQWQTWGGVNNTDYLLVARHIAGTQYLPATPPVVQITASTKLPHPAINSADGTAIRQAAKFPAIGWQYFDIPKWVFSGMDAATSLDNIIVDCGDVTRDIRGLCAGDVNGSLVPTAGYKTADPGLELVNRGKLPVTDEIVFPIRVERDMEIGAITLMLDYDPSLIEIADIEMPQNAGVEPWFELHNGLLYIGWISTEPVNIAKNQIAVLIRAHLKTPVAETGTGASSQLSKPIRFTLNNNPLSEFADSKGKVIDGLTLSIPDATGKPEWRNSEILIYPNPATSTLNVQLETFNLKPETFTLELVNMHGITVLTNQPETIVSGWNKYQMDVNGMAPGVYFLRANVGGEILINKVLISR